MVRQWSAKPLYSGSNPLAASKNAGMAELADARDLKSRDRKVMRVRPPLPAPFLLQITIKKQFFSLDKHAFQGYLIKHIGLVRKAQPEPEVRLLFL